MQQLQHKPLISVIVPFYNAEQFLEETINTVLQQSYTHWELLLIDDGSNDNSTNIAKEYEKKNAGKIIYLQHKNHKNKGVTFSRNLGIEKAKGEWISFLDSDDLWLTGKLNKQVEILVQYPMATAFCEATNYWYPQAENHQEYEVKYIGVAADKLYAPPTLAAKLYPLVPKTAPSMCGIIIKTSALKSFGGFDESFTGSNQLFEDQAFLYKIYLSQVVYISSICNNIYRQRSNSLMHGLKNEGYYLQGKLFFLQWLKAYLIKQQINDAEINWLLKKNIYACKYPALYKTATKLKRKYKMLVNK